MPFLEGRRGRAGPHGGEEEPQPGLGAAGAARLAEGRRRQQQEEEEERAAASWLGCP